MRSDPGRQYPDGSAHVRGFIVWPGRSASLRQELKAGMVVLMPATATDPVGDSSEWPMIEASIYDRISFNQNLQLRPVTVAARAF